MENTLFFQMLWSMRNSHNGDTSEDLWWFWRDENCVEPIGPFGTREEAVFDYNQYGGGD